MDSICKIIGIAGLIPTSMYGLWEQIKETSKGRKRNLAVTSGKGLGADTSNTLAIEMVYGSEAQPYVRAHMEHVEAWLRYYDKHKDTNKREHVEAAWCKALANIERMHKHRRNGTDLMLSAMSASIISLRLINFAPRSMHTWTDESE